MDFAIQLWEKHVFIKTNKDAFKILKKKDT